MVKKVVKLNQKSGGREMAMMVNNSNSGEFVLPQFSKVH